MGKTKVTKETNPIILVVPSTGNTAQLHRFIDCVKQMPEVKSLRSIGYWGQSEIIFDVDKTVALTDITKELWAMREVQTVEELWRDNRKIRYNAILVRLVS